MRRYLVAILAVCGTALPLAGAAATPQVLGLLATRAPVPLKCAGAECAAELTSFCLQRGRDVPAAGTAYRVAGGGVELIAVAADGRSRRLPAAGHLSVVSARSFTAVRVAVPVAALEALGAARLAVAVGENVSLLPAAGARDAAGIAAATGPLRRLASRLVDGAGPEAGALRLTSRLINALPQRASPGAAAAEALWRAARAAGPAADAAARRAEATYRACRRRVEAGIFYRLRNCLTTAHDDMARRLTRRVWAAAAES